MSLVLYWKVNSFLFGALIGSFLNVVINRIPKNKSVITPRSACESCGHQIRWFENIPIVSFISLRGKCSNCSTKISYQYPLIELICGLAALYLFPELINKKSLIFFTIKFSIFATLLAMTVIDIKLHLIPDKLNLFLLAIILPFSIVQNGYQFPIIGGVVGFGGTFLITWVYFKVRGVIGLGGGDIKLFGVLGVLLGPKGIILNIFISCFVGLIFSLLLMTINKLKFKNHLAFGPYICLVGIIQIFFPERFYQVVSYVLSI